MTLTPEGQELLDFAIGALPSWVRANDEFLTAAAAVMALARSQNSYLFGQALITTAEGATASTPDWLNQHARDRDTSRQAGETDPVLRERLRVIPDALTRQAILDAANAILAASGVVGSVSMLELPRDGAWMGVYDAMFGVGGLFVQSGSVSSFAPMDLPWPAPPIRSASVFPDLKFNLFISDAAEAGNNGARLITGLQGNSVVVTNASGVFSFDGAVHWKAHRSDGLGNPTDGFARSYVGRGWRASTSRPFKILMILPFGTSAGTQASIEESIRAKKAAGFKLIVERRTSP